ncbi:unnamed protein product [Prorocentrum cordatum]|uniref:Protein kinase domain-containing protein n=1 Tax=Prorocentrum cordatum TaxID=2364126 RepID=A0ABN9YJU2_9DINO|nr:unnamed protein product [Polarella glacialis]
MGRTLRWARAVLKLGQFRAKSRSEVRATRGTKCKDDLNDGASTAASFNDLSSRTLSEFDDVVCSASSSSSIDDGVPELPGSPLALARTDTFTRKSALPAGSEGWTMSNFEVVRALGEGSMGSVRLVKLANARDDATFALKMIDKSHITRENQKERAMQEKQLLGLVSHPFVVKFFGAFQDDSHLFMLMEFVGGGDLFSAIRCSKFDDSCAHFFAAEITLALTHIHSLDIVHRDLKPENVVIDQRGHAKIVDFGLAKVVQTTTYTICGTVDYMAPEVLSNIGHGKCVDWWALGILIFEMLAIGTPFMGRSARETRKNVLDRDPRCPPYFGSVTKSLVYLLLIKDPTLRLGSGADGSQRVRSHSWFSSVDWGALLQQRCASPFLPSAGGAPAPRLPAAPPPAPP